MSEIKFLSIRFRAFAQATEIEERVLAAMKFASGTEEVNVTATTGHFGNPITVFETELLKAGQIKNFLGRLAEAHIPENLIGQEEERVDEECAFHFRLDKQKAYLEELALASGRDVIDVRLKVGVYPARREAAVAAIKEWLAD
ncbi:MAG: hypothetical protein KKH41_06100 [Candidatus Thermoplasmatota archaeon]|nr:hypothetical protein [Candidatus Thermoplasmatota archaeon]MBU4071740.1 hypothetical protein [Candidatus Thermoplasmatota archaeon]MBU4144590.1 hypothetical protein [Candidatus Thermoplasmatota archaeon]MBU4592139.1 hypothetical protein [Candidatus Thermoplasmatota archaeon]